MSHCDVIAFYHLATIEDPDAEVRRHKEFFRDRDIRSRIYINAQGINGQMSAKPEDGEAYRRWLTDRAPFTTATFKIDPWHEHVFPRTTVKHRKALVAYDETVDLTKRGRHISPEQWKEMLDSGEKLLIDVRNDYEWEIGRFAGAELPPCRTFREFNDYATKLATTTDKKTPIMMYCTGGIRCELYSSVLIDAGFEEVYQLDGGVINYGHKVGSAHWLGKLFVFDDRMAVSISPEATPIISTCFQCQTPSDTYYNCANMDCNDLFICCPDCLKTLQGCCSSDCTSAPRVRPYHEQNPHKPFRKWYHYTDQK